MTVERSLENGILTRSLASYAASKPVILQLLNIMYQTEQISLTLYFTFPLRLKQLSVLLVPTLPNTGSIKYMQ